MKIAYIANARMPTEKAHGLQIAEMCRAFARLGHDVTLVVPKRKNPIEATVWDYYGIEPGVFRIVYVEVLDALRYARQLGNVALWLASVSFGRQAARIVRELAADVVYSRDPFSALWIPQGPLRVFEAHEFPPRRPALYRPLWKRFDRIVTVTEGLRQAFIRRAGVPETKMMAAHDAVDLAEFSGVPEKTPGPFTVAYIGHLYQRKGASDLVEAARRIGPGVRFMIVGGAGDDLLRVRKEAAGLDHVTVTGHLTHREAIRHLLSADMAVLPNRAGSDYDERYTSPMKLFEYLAAGKAILASDLPAVREVLDEHAAEFFPPGDVEALSRAIQGLAKRPDRIAALEAASRGLARKHTWEGRAGAIAEWLAPVVGEIPPACLRIAYIANARMPTEKAHGLQIAEMCRAFARLGHDVTLVVPKRKNPIEATVWDYYGIEPGVFRIREIPVLDLIPYDRWLGHWPFRLASVLFALRCRRIIEDLDPDLIYSRDPFSSVLMPGRWPLVYEAHTFPRSQHWFHRILWKSCKRLVVMTEGLRRAFAAAGVLETRLQVAHDAVDPDDFAVEEEKSRLRRSLGLPPDVVIAVYAGHLYPYTGIDDILAAAADFAPNIRLLVVGGRTTDLEAAKAQVARLGLRDVVFTGHVPHRDVPRYLRASDIAIMAYRDDGRHVTHYASPLKLFEYLAAGKAIVTTDLPSVREVLEDSMAVFTSPGRPKALAEAVNALASDPTRRAILEATARSRVERHTWKARAARVLEGIRYPKRQWIPSFFERYRLEFNLAFLALGIRLAYVALVPQYPIEGGDGPFYTAAADWLRGAGAWDPRWTFFQPGYPLLLAAVRELFGTDLVWGRIIQAFLGAGTVFVTMMMARRWVSAYAAWVAGLIGALYVPAILETGIYYTETTYTFLLILSLYLILAAVSRKTVLAGAVAGLGFVAAGLVRELGFYLGFISAVMFGVWKRAPKAMAPIVVLILMAMSGLAAHNRTTAEWLRTQGTRVDNVPVVAKGYELTLGESVFWNAALDSRRLYLYPVGVWHFFRFPFRLTDLTGEDVGAKAVLFGGDAALLARHWPQIFGKAAVVGIHWLLLALAILGVVRGRMAAEVRATMLLAIAFAAGTIILNGVGRIQCDFACYEPLARYRFPVDPLIIIFAATGLEWWSRKRGEVPE